MLEEPNQSSVQNCQKNRHFIYIERHPITKLIVIFRAPEMIDIYNGQPITIKADIWVSFYSYQF